MGYLNEAVSRITVDGRGDVSSPSSFFPRIHIFRDGVLIDLVVYFER